MLKLILDLGCLQMLQAVATPLLEMLHLKSLAINDVVPKAFGIAPFSTSTSFDAFLL
jgi:hypothetical protein